MTKKEAWKILSEGCSDGHDPVEYEECKDEIDTYWEAYDVVKRSINRKWWEFWK